MATCNTTLKLSYVVYYMQTQKLCIRRWWPDFCFIKLKLLYENPCQCLCNLFLYDYSVCLSLQAKTSEDILSPERQASTTMEALPYKTKSNNFIHIGKEHKKEGGHGGGSGKVCTMHSILSVSSTHCNMYFFAGVDTAELALGDNLKISLNLNRQLNQDNDITYLVRDALHLCMCAHVSFFKNFFIPSCWISAHV